MNLPRTGNVQRKQLLRWAAAGAVRCFVTRAPPSASSVASPLARGAPITPSSIATPHSMSTNSVSARAQHSARRAECAAIEADISRCGSVEEVMAHYRRFQFQYHTLSHLAAAAKIASLDARRRSLDAVLPHLVALEKFLASEVHCMAAQDVLCHLYISAAYNRLIPPRLFVLVVERLQKLSADSVTAGPRATEHFNLDWLERDARMASPAAAVLQGPPSGLPEQTVALRVISSALWALARHDLHIPAVCEPLARAASERLRATTSHHPDYMSSSSSDDVLRVAWAVAKLGLAGSDFPSALSSYVAQHMNWHEPPPPQQQQLRLHPSTLFSGAAAPDRSPPQLLAASSMPRKSSSSNSFTLAQRVLLAWSCVTLRCYDDVCQRLTVEVFEEIRVSRSAQVTASTTTRQQLRQLHAFFCSDRANVALPTLPPLPAWLLQADETEAASGATPRAFGSSSDAVSTVMTRLGLHHVRDLVVDGFSIDIALPALRVAIEVLHPIPPPVRRERRTGTGVSSDAAAGHAGPPDRKHHHADTVVVASSSSSDLRFASFGDAAAPLPAGTACLPQEWLGFTDTVPARSEYLTLKGWRTAALDVSQWKRLGPQARASSLLALVRGTSNR